MSQVVSIRLKDGQAERLKRFARRAGKSQSELGALFIEEKMREADFALIEFRSSAIGRQAYMKNSSLAVWEVVQVAIEHGMDTQATSTYFNRPVEWVKAALHYYAGYPEEIDQTLEDNRAMTYDKLKRLLPQLEPAEMAQSVPDSLER